MSIRGAHATGFASASRAALLFVAFHALYALTSSGNVFRAPDEFEVYFQTEHLVDAGDLSVPQALAIRQPIIVDGRVVGSQSMFFGEIGRDGRPYAPYGPLVAMLAVPHHLLGRAMAAVAGVRRAPLPGGIAWLMVVGGVTMLATATAGALAVAGFHRAATAAGAHVRWATTLAIVLGTGTALWPYSTSFFSEAWQAAAFVWAAALLMEARNRSTGSDRRQAALKPCATDGRGRGAVAGASALLFAAGLTKMTSLVFAPAFVVAALVERRVERRARLETALALGVGIAGAAAAHLLWNLHRFGRPFDFGYDWSETIPQLPARAFLASDIPRGLAVLLLSPGKSIVIWAPALIVAIIAFRRFRSRDAAAGIGVLTAASVGILFYAAYLFPEGGYSHGPRNLVPILPLLLLPAVGAGSEPPSGVRTALAVCAGAGAIVALLATSVSYLEDQSLGGDLTSGARTVYYSRIDPPAGRVWNRYRLDYLPFVSTLRSPGWLSEPNLGQGPDYFPLHLLQARRQLPDGPSIPLWLIWGWPAAWAVILVGSGVALRRSPSVVDAGRVRVDIEGRSADEPDERDPHRLGEVDRQARWR
jgi:hypothetical protein